MASIKELRVCDNPDVWNRAKMRSDNMKQPYWRTFSLHGFTLVELLVVISIIALLVAILLPALSKTREQGKQTICRINLRSIGVGLYLYQEATDGLLPPQYDRWGPIRQTYDNTHIEPWASYVAFHDEDRSSSGQLIPLQLGILFARQLIEKSETFYCLSQLNKGFHRPYSYDYNTKQAGDPWGSVLPLRDDGASDNKIRVSYNYWLHGHNTFDRLTQKAIVTDTIQHWNVVSHRNNHQPQGINVLYGDGHVRYQTNPKIFDASLWSGGASAGPWDGPGNNKAMFEEILNLFKP